MTNSDLSIKLYFDLDNNRYRIEDETDYAGEGISTANVVGVYKYTDPNSNILYENTDFSNPDVDVDVSLYSSYDTFVAVDGVQTIVYSVYDSNTTYTKTFTFTYDADDIPDVVIGVEHNIGLATIESTDETAYTVSGGTITLNSRTHTLTWPDGTENTETSTSVDSISLTELNTGEYTSSVESVITITKDDDLIINITIDDEETHDVWDSDGMYAVRLALDTFYDRWITAETDNPKKGREYAAKWVKISSNYALYNSHKQNGDLENSGEYLNNIKTLLAAEGIDTDIDPSISVPVSASLPGYANMWDSDSGEPSDSLNRNNDYYLDDITGDYYKKEDGTYSKQGTLGTYVVYAVSGTIIVPTDEDGNNADYTNASTDILVYRGGSDDTDNWSFTKDSVSGADGTVGSGILTITSITADTGYIDILCEKSGVDNITLRVYVKKVKSGQAIVDSTSVDNDTIGLNASDKLEVKDNSIDVDKMDGSLLGGFNLLTSATIGAVGGLGISAPLRIFPVDYNKVGVMYDTVGDLFYGLRCYSFNFSTNDVVSVGNIKDTGITPSFLMSDPSLLMWNSCNLTKDAGAILIKRDSSGANDVIYAYVFDGTTWSVSGSVSVEGESSGNEEYFLDMCKIDDSIIAVVMKEQLTNTMFIRQYSWDGSSFSQVGTDYSLVTATDYVYDGRIVRLNRDDIMVDFYHGTTVEDTFERKILSRDGVTFSESYAVNNESITYSSLSYHWYSFKDYQILECSSSGFDLYYVNDGYLYDGGNVYSGDAYSAACLLLNGAIAVARFNSENNYVLDILYNNSIH